MPHPLAAVPSLIGVPMYHGLRDKECPHCRDRGWINRIIEALEGSLTKDNASSDDESVASEVVSVGRALFKDGEPGDPELQRRYRLYKRLEGALERPAGPQRLEALY